ncbi:MAG: nucleotidyltransferase family protein [Bacteroidales bacterium]|nr:nucleotidyltransferase family protein [Bacteroidales bacterium]
MDSEGVKLLFVFDKDFFLGIITIGDIQRAIIKSVVLNESIFTILDSKKIYGKETDSIEVIKHKMLGLRAEAMPVVSKNGNLIEVYFWKDLFGGNHQIERKRIDLPVVIMAGGLGTRLKPLTNIIPKPLIPINEKTILEIIMDKFIDIGCSRFYMSVNYKHDILRYYLDSLETKYNIIFFKEEHPLGTIGSVSLLKGKFNTPFFVTNCDIIIDQDFRDVYDYHRKNRNDITIVTAIKNYQIPYGVVESGENGVMVALSEKPEMTYMINTGVYILQPELINEIPVNKFFHITQLIEKINYNKGKIGCFPVSEKSWTDIGDWDQYLKLIKK